MPSAALHSPSVSSNAQERHTYSNNFHCLSSTPVYERHGEQRSKILTMSSSSLVPPVDYSKHTRLGKPGKLGGQGRKGSCASLPSVFQNSPWKKVGLVLKVDTPLSPQEENPVANSSLTILPSNETDCSHRVTEDVLVQDRTPHVHHQKAMGNTGGSAKMIRRRTSSQPQTARERVRATLTSLARKASAKFLAVSSLAAIRRRKHELSGHVTTATTFKATMQTCPSSGVRASGVDASGEPPYHTSSSSPMPPRTLRCRRSFTWNKNTLATEYATQSSSEQSQPIQFSTNDSSQRTVPTVPTPYGLEQQMGVSDKQEGSGTGFPQLRVTIPRRVKQKFTRPLSFPGTDLKLLSSKLGTQVTDAYMDDSAILGTNSAAFGRAEEINDAQGLTQLFQNESEHDPEKGHADTVSPSARNSMKFGESQPVWGTPHNHLSELTPSEKRRLKRASAPSTFVEPFEVKGGICHPKEASRYRRLSSTISSLFNHGFHYLGEETKQLGTMTSVEISSNFQQPNDSYYPASPIMTNDAIFYAMLEQARGRYWYCHDRTNTKGAMIVDFALQESAEEDTNPSNEPTHGHVLTLEDTQSYLPSVLTGTKSSSSSSTVADVSRSQEAGPDTIVKPVWSPSATSPTVSSSHCSFMGGSASRSVSFGSRSTTLPSPASLLLIISDSGAAVKDDGPPSACSSDGSHVPLVATDLMRPTNLPLAISDPGAAALLSRVGQASGQELLMSSSEGAESGNSELWRKEVHALFVIRELLWTESSYNRHLTALLNAVHVALGRTSTRDQLDHASTKHHLLTLASALPGLIQISDSIQSLIQAQATAAGVGSAFLQLASKLETVLVSWACMVPVVMSGLRDAELKVPRPDSMATFSTQSRSYKRKTPAPRSPSLGLLPAIPSHAQVSGASTPDSSVRRTFSYPIAHPSSTIELSTAQENSFFPKQLDLDMVDKTLMTTFTAVESTTKPEDLDKRLIDLDRELNLASPIPFTTTHISQAATSRTTGSGTVRFDGANLSKKPVVLPRKGHTSAPSVRPIVPTWTHPSPLSPHKSRYALSSIISNINGSSTASRSLTALDIAIMPTQRMPQYMLLLLNLQKAIPAGSDTSVLLTEALGVVRRISSLCDQATSTPP